ncbi:MAG: TIM barrel protein [Planctomycetes bacterium]|nr:TIM barrel protein [Planctomycetota bacterium]
MTANRREFLHAAAGIGALAALGSVTSARSRTDVEDNDVKPQRTFSISLAEWSYHSALQKGSMKHAEFAQVARAKHGLGAVEYVNSFFKDKARDTDYLKDLKTRADDQQVKILLIMCDGEGDLGHAEKQKRTEAVENHKQWLDAARALGCHSIRVNVSGSGTRTDHMHQAAESLQALAQLADPLNLNVIVENHGGITSDGAWLAGVMRKADHKRVGTLPDFGNFKISDSELYDRYQGVAELMPWAKAVSAKSHDFDEKGEETATDYTRMLKIVLDAGYRGYVGIEYEGSRLSEHDGVEATKRLLERVRSAAR